jgi:heavy metal sensor kinase
MSLPIRARLAAVCAFLVGVLVVGLGALVYLRLEADLQAAADDELLSRAELLVQEAPGGAALEPGTSDAGDIFAQILTRDGTVVASTPGLGPDPVVPRVGLGTLAGPRSFEATVPTVDEPVLARVLEVPTVDGQVVVTGVAFDDQREVLDRLRSLFAVAGLVAIALAGAVGWIVAGAALRPIDRMRIEAEAVSGSEPGRRLPVPGTRDELAALGGSLNRMLDRLETAVERERRFVADAGHELRTPLANLKAELDLALRRSRSPSELVASLRSASDETDRLTRLAEDLLLLAGADAGRVPMRREDVDVVTLVQDTVDSFSGRAAEVGIEIDTSIADGLRASVDGTRIRQAVGDLIDNAMRHTPPGGRVSVEATRSDGMLVISVADTGDGFPPAFLPHAFEPFARADASRSRAEGGAGLGLAIVQVIAEGHGGTVVARNGNQGGAVVVLSIPG